MTSRSNDVLSECLPGLEAGLLISSNGLNGLAVGSFSGPSFFVSTCSCCSSDADLSSRRSGTWSPTAPFPLDALCSSSLLRWIHFDRCSRPLLWWGSWIVRVVRGRELEVDRVTQSHHSHLLLSSSPSPSSSCSFGPLSVSHPPRYLRLVCQPNWRSSKSQISAENIFNKFPDILMNVRRRNVVSSNTNRSSGLQLRRPFRIARAFIALTDFTKRFDREQTIRIVQREFLFQMLQKRQKKPWRVGTSTCGIKIWCASLSRSRIGRDSMWHSRNSGASTYSRLPSLQPTPRCSQILSLLDR